MHVDVEALDNAADLAFKAIDSVSICLRSYNLTQYRLISDLHCIYFVQHRLQTSEVRRDTISQRMVAGLKVVKSQLADRVGAVLQGLVDHGIFAVKIFLKARTWIDKTFTLRSNCGFNMVKHCCSSSNFLNKPRSVLLFATTAFRTS